MSLVIKNKEYPLPIYLPDATNAVVKSLDSFDLASAGVKGAVVNTFHLMNQPGMENLKLAGGIKKFMNFDGLIVSDSGGWQVFSLIHRSNRPGKITDDGVTFHLDGIKHAVFTPEKSIQVQFDIGSDILICLDDFTPPDASQAEIKVSVERTIAWAKRCKEEFNRLIEKNSLDDSTRPHLYAVIQGGFDKDLRAYCAEELIKLDFDGYGYGGYAIKDGVFDLELSEFIANLIPNNKIKFALGVGHPSDIAHCFSYGWDIFDCTLPTRDARHQRLYSFKWEPTSMDDLLNPEIYEYIYIHKSIYAKDFSPLTIHCNCHTCSNFNKAYLYHLFKTDKSTAFRLASIHNLKVYTSLLSYLQEFQKPTT